MRPVHAQMLAHVAPWSLSIQAAMTKYQRLGGLQTTDTYFSHFWKLEVRDQGASMLGESPFPGSDFLLCPLMAEGPEVLSISFIKAQMTFMSVLPSRLNHLPNLTLGVSFCHMNGVVGAQRFRPQYLSSFRYESPDK